MKRFEVWLVGLDPTVGREINKTRPCVIISPDEMNPLSTVIVAPLTSKGFMFPGRVATRFQDKDGFILLDQMRAVDKQRLYQRLGAVDRQTISSLCAVLQEMFAC
ncbi:MAG: type II toxin-antitoxin system PemK/MazF family toxin [Chloroflexi bacterium]|nr:type II toxin-antitoxin system PemK/MazF family toxin [Chloroflexota bacterium]